MVTLIVAVLALAAVIGTLYFVGRGVQVSNGRITHRQGTARPARNSRTAGAGEGS